MNILDALSSGHTHLIVHAADVDLGQLFGKLRAPFRARAAERGLGLAFARLAAEAHGGRISVQDSALGGARFELLLPNSPPCP